MQIPFRGSGIVYYSNKEYKCSLYYTEEGGGIVLQIKHHSEHGIGDFLEVPLEIEKLSGKLDSGYEFTLLELNRGGMNDNISTGVTVYTYYAEYLLSGIKNTSTEGQTFSKVDFVLADIVEWGEESIYSIGENYELKAKQEPVSKIIYEGEDYSIYYKVIGSFLPCVDYELLKDEICLKQHGIIEIIFSREKNFKEFVEVFDKLKRLFEIALLRTVRVEKIYAFSNKIRDDYGDKSFERQIDIYGRSIKAIEEENIEQTRRFNWITLSDLIENNSVVTYLNKHEKLEPVIDLYIELFYLKGNTGTRTFLNVVQALETYHSRFVTNDMQVFKQRIAALKQGLSSTNAEYVEKTLMANSNKFVTLESRLADLLYAEGNIYFDTGDIKRDDFPAVIARTRNYYIHYDENIKNKYKILTIDELNIYKNVLFQILEYYILYELGFSVENRSKKIRDRWGSVSNELQILKASRNKKSQVEDIM